MRGTCLAKSERALGGMTPPRSYIPAPYYLVVIDVRNELENKQGWRALGGGLESRGTKARFWLWPQDLAYHRKPGSQLRWKVLLRAAMKNHLAMRVSHGRSLPSRVILY